MREVAANTYSFLKALKSSSITSRTLIIELDVIVNIVANRLDALPSARGLTRATRRVHSASAYRSIGSQ